MTSLPRAGHHWSHDWSRRAWLATGAAAGSLLAITPAFRNHQSKSVFIARNQSYDRSLTKVIEDGLKATGIDLKALRGKRVLLKPNLVEPTRRAPHMTTHPAVVHAAIEVFRRHQSEVLVGEAPGHVRDSVYAVEESGLDEVLKDQNMTFSDLNYEDVGWRPNKGRFSDLPGLFFPRSILEADLVVSMPKLKTHHWMGMTGAMKNLFGAVPGSVYGWPKNVLHHAGIAETICDINAAMPRLATIVDGIQCMEGDGPILGTPKAMGLVLVGSSLPAVDATICRLMQLNPQRIPYLRLANRRLGPVSEHLIQQRGESWEDLTQPFEILDEPHLQAYREGVLIS